MLVGALRLVINSSVSLCQRRTSRKMSPTEREKVVGVLASQFAPFLVAGLREALVLGGQNYRFLIGQALKGTSAKVNQHPKWKQVYRQFYR